MWLWCHFGVIVWIGYIPLGCEYFETYYSVETFKTLKQTYSSQSDMYCFIITHFHWVIRVCGLFFCVIVWIGYMSLGCEYFETHHSMEILQTPKQNLSSQNNMHCWIITHLLWVMWLWCHFLCHCMNWVYAVGMWISGSLPFSRNFQNTERNLFITKGHVMFHYNSLPLSLGLWPFFVSLYELLVCHRDVIILKPTIQ